MSQDTSLTGVLGAINAVALNDSGSRVFFYDRSVRSLLRLDCSNGERTTFKFLDKDLQRQRWLCYCLFYWCNANSSCDLLGRIAILWYNQSKKKFCMTTHRLMPDAELTMIDDKLYLDMDAAFDSVGYSAQHKDGRVELIFYEIKSATKQRFWFFDYNMRNAKLNRSRIGVLPASHWELPFTSDQRLHFVAVRKSQTMLATLSLSEEQSEWLVSDILLDSNSAVRFSRRGFIANKFIKPNSALWCNCWHQQLAIFLVSRFAEGRTKAELWALDVQMASWKHIKTALDLEGEISNFSIRLYDNNHLFIHYESSDGASFCHVENLVRDVKSAFATEVFDSSVGIGLADVICPICLENYENPRALDCGHSLCDSHLKNLTSKETNLNVIRCPICRAPSYKQLSINYALKEAIETLNKVRKQQTFDQRCTTCRLACIEDELWHCLDCNDPSESVCANCTLKNHAAHKLQNAHDYKENLAKSEKLHKELETQALVLYQNFQNELAAKFRLSVFEKVRDLHANCLRNYGQTSAERLGYVEMQKRKAMCLKHFSYVFEEILRSSDEFVQSLEDSLFVENSCSAFEALQKSTEI